MINTTIIKVAVWLLVIKEIWLLLQVPSIANAVISFCTVGAIPGTNQTLSPGSTVIVLGVTFVVAALLIFHGGFMSLLRVVFNRPARHQPVAVAPVMPLAPLPAKSAKVAPPTSPVVAQTKAPKAPQVPIASIIAKLQILLRTYTAPLGRAVHLFVVQVWHTSMRLFATLKVWARAFGVLAVDLAALIGVIIADLSVRAWRWTKPRIERFDKYLEQKAHKNPYTDAAIKTGIDVFTAIKRWWAEIQDKESAPKLEHK